MFRFDHDWFSPNIQNLTNLFSGYQKDQPPKILEIGALEGRSTVWFLNNIPNCTVTTIDTWCGGKDHDPNNPEINFTKIKENFDNNISYFKDRVRVMHMDSFTALTQLIKEDQKYDFAYIDGSHTAIDANLDLILSFKLLNVNSIIYADDYYWGFNEYPVHDCPKLGIDSFVNVYEHKLKPMKRLDNQAAVYLKVSE